jgi:hypothetical protein
MTLISLITPLLLSEVASLGINAACASCYLQSKSFCTRQELDPDEFPRWITFHDKFSGESPCFFCEKCYQAFHYDQEGRLLYEDFQVFPYAYD